jgi:hypothetical protein
VKHIRRGPFFIYNESHDNVCVFLGERSSPESEHIVTIHKSYLPALIAGLKAVQESKHAKD